MLVRALSRNYFSSLRGPTRRHNTLNKAAALWGGSAVSVRPFRRPDVLDQPWDERWEYMWMKSSLLVFSLWNLGSKKITSFKEYKSCFDDGYSEGFFEEFATQLFNQCFNMGFYFIILGGWILFNSSSIYRFFNNCVEVRLQQIMFRWVCCFPRRACWSVEGAFLYWVLFFNGYLLQGEPFPCKLYQEWCLLTAVSAIQSFVICGWKAPFYDCLG